jgi:class 3 adenylate cyclase
MTMRKSADCPAVAEVPETSFAETPGGRIAYQVVGDGPIDVLVTHSPMFPIDLMWDEPGLVRFLDRLSSFSHHVWFDPRGRGASDPLPHEEERFAEAIADDMLALLDHLGWEQAALVGDINPQILFAATHPERTKALVLINSGARLANLREPSESSPTGAKVVELPGEDFLFFVGDSGPLVDAIEEFLTGQLPAHHSDRVLSTVLYTDIVGSTEFIAQVGDRRWKELLDDHDALAQAEVERFRGRIVQSTGDGVLAIFDGPGRAIRCGCAIRDAVRSLGMDVRVGLHSGEIELRGDDVAGMAVHIGARVSALAGAGEVFVSSTVRDLVAGSGIDFQDRGEYELKGVPGTWKIYAVTG